MLEKLLGWEFVGRYDSIEKNRLPIHENIINIIERKLYKNGGKVTYVNGDSFEYKAMPHGYKVIKAGRAEFGTPFTVDIFRRLR